MIFFVELLFYGCFVRSWDVDSSLGLFMYASLKLFWNQNLKNSEWSTEKQTRGLYGCDNWRNKQRKEKFLYCIEEILWCTINVLRKPEASLLSRVSLLHGTFKHSAKYSPDLIRTVQVKLVHMQHNVGLCGPQPATQERRASFVCLVHSAGHGFSLRSEENTVSMPWSL